jgi:hypothetical protein
VPACRNWSWNFFNATAVAAFLSVVEGLVASDPTNSKFDGIFFGAAQTFAEEDPHWKGAANLPADTSDAAVRQIWIGIISRVCSICAAHGKYPMFNLHLDGLNVGITGASSGNEAAFMGNLSGQGLVRFNEGSPQPASLKYMDNRLKVVSAT